MQNQLSTIRERMPATLKALRRKSAWTQVGTAKRLNIDRGAYASYEDGRAFPPNEMLIAMSELWGISIEELVKGKKSAFVVDAKNFS